MQITVDVNKDVMQMWTEKTENCKSADRKEKKCRRKNAIDNKRQQKGKKKEKERSQEKKEKTSERKKGKGKE